MYLSACMLGSESPVCVYGSLQCKEGITCETGRWIAFPIGDMLYIRGVVCIVVLLRVNN